MRASTPAFAHSRFTPPACATISLAAAASDSTDVTSTPIPNARPPADSISAATASAFDALDVGHRDRHPLGAERERDAASDPAAAARHDGHPPFQVVHHGESPRW